MKFKSLTIRLSIDKYNELKILAKIKDVSFNHLINDLIDNELKSNKDKIKKFLEIYKAIMED